MGPALSTSASSRPIGRLGIASPAMPSTSGPTAKTATASSVKHSGLESLDHDEDEELFSEPDEGVEMIDLQSVQRLDWTAPESLRRIRKAETQGKQERHEEMGTDNLTNRSDELHLAADTDFQEDPILELQTQSLFSIQFPTPFPTFSPAPDLCSQGVVNPKHDGMSRKVTFALDTKPPTVPTPSTSSTTGTEQPSESKASEAVDGVIGQLELYRNGTIRIRMPNGILFDMKSATQLAFQEQAVILNRADNRLTVLGEIDKRYVVSPDVDALLVAMDVADRSVGVAEIEEGLIAMDTT
ncbi:hypothetical protein M378DRAFT_157757 [Amanita muscaria Koide BX008]|uniref:Uncharacterized protein n=1 Tax=Amanita muscaria (strain Koide BX008) TaxID=946122 RepID=A0A0C2XKC3_AMAMK|nr:hypothetical protein M378DRAFT_157757 [Amanita muscaria Koide BX008]